MILMIFLLLFPKKALPEKFSDITLLPGDVIYINVPGQRELSHKYDISPNGDLYVMIIGKIPVKGMSIKDLEDKLTAELSTYIEGGKRITIKLIKRTRYIQVVGGVKYPGWYRVPCITTLEDIIEKAGGILPGVDISKAWLIRNNKRINLKLKSPIKFFPDDVVYIPKPREYVEKVDTGDLLFINIPQKTPPTIPGSANIMNLKMALKWNQIEVDENGFIYIPEYGHFYVNGKTPEQIREMIKERLPKYLQKAGKIDVGVIEKKHFVKVLGHVVRPGKYNIPENANIQEAIAAAGGAIDGAVMSDIMIRRKRKDGKEEIIRVNLYQFKITGDPRLLTPIHEGDIIFVPISPTFGNIKRTLNVWSPPQTKLEKEVKKKVIILGAVHRPGVYEPKEGLDLLTLIAQAGGFRDDAEISNILIIRGGKVYMRYNLEKFLSEFKMEVKRIPKILPGDIVYVRFQYKARGRIFIIGNVNRPGSYELYDNMTVLQALGCAGGLNEWADADHIIIVRMIRGKQKNIYFSYNKAIKGKHPEVNIRLKANDVIIVP